MLTLMPDKRDKWSRRFDWIQVDEVQDAQQKVPFLGDIPIVGYAFFVVNEKQIMIDYDIRRSRVLKIKQSAGKSGGALPEHRE